MATPNSTPRAPSPIASLHQHASKSLRPILMALMAFGLGHEFEARPSAHHKHRLRELAEKEAGFGAARTVMYCGLAALSSPDSVAVSIAIHDTVYSIDYCVGHLKFTPDSATTVLTASEGPDTKGGTAPSPAIGSNRGALIAEYVVYELQKYEKEHMCKFIGCGLPAELMELSPQLCSRLWLELDIIPVALHVGAASRGEGDRDGIPEGGMGKHKHWKAKSIDEQADSMARRAIMFFGPINQPWLQVGWRNVVEIDAGYRVHMVTRADYERTVGAATWRAVNKYAADLRNRGVKVAFFSSTPQGGGVALMRHALVRFLKTLGVDVEWYVPKPKPGVFRITKTNHNILQGVSLPIEHLTPPQKLALTSWIQENATRYWLSEGGPLRPVSEGGADVVIIDDPQMPGLIPMIKDLTPERPVVYRSHIEIRSDLVAKEGSPQADAWGYLWEGIKRADVFISHPVARFVPENVPAEMVGYMPAATDWLDGLNKPMRDWDLGYYGHKFNVACDDIGMTKLKYPARQYIVQIARFDPSKGIPDVLKAYATFRRKHLKGWKKEDTPQLLICGHGSIDDPDATLIYDQTLTLLETSYAELQGDISVMRLPPSDQLLNGLLSSAKIALQLSTREGFEVKVSEALHKGIPVICTRAGGIPLQVGTGMGEKGGWLVEVGDTDSVAQKLFYLWTDHALWEKMSKAARRGVSDEVGTVGNALSWLHLASELSQGRMVKPGGRWINDLAREGAGEPYKEGENRLPRGELEGRPSPRPLSPYDRPLSPSAFLMRRLRWGSSADGGVGAWQMFI